MSSPPTQALGPSSGGRLAVGGQLSMVEWAFMALALFAVHILLQENGILFSDQIAEYLHEFSHDARHSLGAPCH